MSHQYPHLPSLEDSVEEADDAIPEDVDALSSGLNATRISSPSLSLSPPTSSLPTFPPPPPKLQKSQVCNLLRSDDLFSPTQSEGSTVTMVHPGAKGRRLMIPGGWFRRWLEHVGWDPDGEGVDEEGVNVPGLEAAMLENGENKKKTEVDEEKEASSPPPPSKVPFAALLLPSGSPRPELVTFYDYYPVLPDVARALERWYGSVGQPSPCDVASGQITLPNVERSLPSKRQCNACGRPNPSKRCVATGALYCGVSCQSSHWPYHEKFTSAARPTPPLPHRPGLTNLGNSCYMNASLQCVLHAPNIVRPFLSGSIPPPSTSKDSTGGKLSAAFERLANSHTHSRKEYLVPTSFKRSIGSCDAMSNNPIGLSGMQQHDSTEFIIWFLDKLHEDFNKVKVKPYIEEPDLYGTHLPVAAAAARYRAKMRDDSYVIDSCYGQWEVTTICGRCKTKKVKYEEHNTLMLHMDPPAGKKVKKVRCLLFRKPSEEHKRYLKPSEIYVEVPASEMLTSVIKEVRSEHATALPRPPSNAMP